MATPDELDHWLGREADGEPFYAAAPEADLAAVLERELLSIRREKRK